MLGWNATILHAICFLMMYDFPEHYSYSENIYLYILSICILSSSPVVLHYLMVTVSYFICFLQAQKYYFNKIICEPPKSKIYTLAERCRKTI